MPAKTAEIVMNDRELTYTRTFNAPRALVFEAMTKPEHLRNWYGPRKMTMTLCEVDFRVGGKYRYVLKDTGGNEHAFSGRFMEIDPPKRVVQTWCWEGMPDHGTVETATLEEIDGKTKLTSHALFQSKEDMQGWAQSGGPGGMVETMDRLEELVAKLSR